MSVWFEGSNEIECNIQQVKHALENLGEHYVGVISLMPGLTSVELVEQGSDFVTIKTNEGLMKRTNISKRIEAESVVVEFDEEYQAGSKVTAKSHFLDEFTTSEHRCQASHCYERPSRPPDCWASSTESSAVPTLGMLS